MVKQAHVEWDGKNALEPAAARLCHHRHPTDDAIIKTEDWWRIRRMIQDDPCNSIAKLWSENSSRILHAKSSQGSCMVAEGSSIPLQADFNEKASALTTEWFWKFSILDIFGHLDKDPDFVIRVLPVIQLVAFANRHDKMQRRHRFANVLKVFIATLTIIWFLSDDFLCWYSAARGTTCSGAVSYAERNLKYF